MNLNLKNLRLFWCAVLLFSFHTISCPQVHADEKIVFSRYTPPYWQIWSKDLISGEEKQLTTSNMDKKSPQCFNNGGKIIFQSANSEIFTFDTASAKEERILEQFGTIMDYHFSDDTEWISFARLNSDIWDDSEVWIKNSKTDEGIRLTNIPGLQHGPVLTADLQNIIYVSKGGENGGYNLWSMDKSGENLKQLTKGLVHDLTPDITSDGKTIIFSSNRLDNFDIWKLNISDLTLIPLTNYSGLDSSPVFSNDDQRILYVSTENGQKQIWVMNVSGEGKQQITSGENPSHDPDWCSALKGNE